MFQLNQIVRFIIISIFSIFMTANFMVFANSSENNTANKIMIVLDGSGSMWGQIDGVPKLEIARKTLREVLKSVPDTVELGLIAYGHREKGNCKDIELIVAPKAGTATAIADKVDNLRFLGKTPLSAAVQMAAEELRYTEHKASVILITDGLETCNADPCALGNLLESQGVDFTTHVVGFGLSEEEGKQVSCLAENTGGKYFSADDGESLVEALNEIITPEPQVFFTAIDQSGNEIKTQLLNWVIKDANGAVIHRRDAKISTKATLEVGYYNISVTGEYIIGSKDFSYEKQDGNLDQYIIVPVIISNPPEASLSAPNQVGAGAEFEVIWSGPSDENDFIAIVVLGSDEGKSISSAYTQNGNPAKVTAPDGLGIYEIRYIHNKNNRVLASREIEIVAVSASLEAPANVAAGKKFEVNWIGPNAKNDYIAILEVGAEQRKRISYAYTKNGNPARIKAPKETGIYEIRYVLNSSDRTLSSITIIVE